MIQIIRTPKEGAVFLSENPLHIEVKSTLGVDYFFKVFLKVNDQTFDIQGWSKYNETNCIIDLKQMFSQLFTNNFTEIDSISLNRIGGLQKKINVTVKEYKRVDDSLVNELSLPFFYVMKSSEQYFFDHTIGLQRLSKLSNKTRVLKNSPFRLPVWIASGSVNLKVISGNEVLFESDHTDLEKGIYGFDVLLRQLHLESDELRIEVTNGVEKLIHYLQIQENTLYEVSPLYFKNEFSVFEYVELFGSLKETNSYTRKTYNLPNNTKLLANTLKTKTYKINTGFLLPPELVVLEAINNSQEVYLLHNYKFIKTIPVSKKSKGLNSEKDYLDDFIELQWNDTVFINNNFKYD